MLKKLIAATLYTALTCSAIPAMANETDEIAEMRAGTMQKLVFHQDAKPASDVTFETRDGKPVTLSDFQGQLLIVNFWATWCAPCRKEMPEFNHLSHKFSEKNVTVLPIATGRNPDQAITKFFEKAKIDAFDSYLDPKGALARDLGIFGLPATLILSPEGEEIARMAGDAAWFSESAQNIIGALVEHYGLTEADLGAATAEN